MKKYLLILTMIITSLFMIGNVSALTDSEEPFYDIYSSTMKKYYSVYIDKTDKIAYVYGGVSNLNSPTSTIDLITYPYFVGWLTTYGQYCYSSKPFYVEGTKIKTGSTFYCSQTNLNQSSKTSYDLLYNDKAILNNFDLYYEDGTLYQKATFDMNTAPTIEITKLKETSVTTLDKIYVTDVTLNIEFSKIDNDKYTYMYKYGIDSEWSTMTLTETNSFTKTFSENNTLYVQVINKLDGSIIVSDTFTTTNIEKLPDVYVEEDTINSSISERDVIFHKCDLNLKTGYALCEITINNIDLNLYNYYYKIGNGKYILFYPDEKTKVLPEVYDTSLLIKSVDDISLYQKWKNATDENTSYSLVLKIYENTRITIIKETKETNIQQFYTFTINTFNKEEAKEFSFWKTFKNSIDYFIEPIGEIFEKITIFFNNLPIEIQYAFLVAFIFIILYYLTKFIL